MKAHVRAVGLLCACVFLFAACSGSGSGAGVTVMSVNDLNGSTGVSVSSKFRYTASPPFDESTVTGSTYFIVPVSTAEASASAKAAMDDTICDVGSALSASLGSSMSTFFDLTPSSTLSYNASYAVCLTDGIAYANGQAFEGFMAQFATEQSAEVTVTLSPADEATGVALDAAVTAVFSGAITEPSDWSAAFTLKKDDEGDSVCTEVTYDSSTLTATCAHADLDRESNYTSSVSGLTSAEGRDIDAASADFTTKASVVISSTKLMRLDGTELDLTDQPIPRSARIKYTLATALSEESDRDAFEAAITVTDADSAEVSGTYEWASDYLSVVFTPSSRLAYQTVYTITVNSSLLPVVGLSLSVSTQQTFTTMTYRDINGDGYADALAGGKGVVDGTYNGAAYVLLGSASGVANCDLSGTCTPDTTIAGENGGGWGTGDKLGTSVSTAGDVNADGYEDIIVGAYDAPGGAGNGTAYVFLGSADGIANCDLSGTCTADATIEGATADDQAGLAVSPAGDVNGDGYDDIFVGAPYASGGGGPGKAYVFLGSASGISDCDLSDSCTADTTFAGAADGDALGISVSTSGDVNGDGYDDVIVGASGAGAGKAYVFLGSASGISDCDLSGACTADSTFTGATDADNFGTSVSTSGDVNGDGYDDVIVGASKVDGVDTDSGVAYLFLGSASGISDCDLSGACTADTTIEGGAKWDYLGGCVSTAGDVNGDGYDDAYMGAPYASGGSGPGKAYVFLGSASGISDCDLSDSCTADTTFTGVDDSAFFGVSVSTSSDVNGDGYDDIIAGSIRYPGGGWQGAAYILLGSSAGISDCDLSDSCTADTTIIAAGDEDTFGYVR